MLHITIQLLAFMLMLIPAISLGSDTPTRHELFEKYGETIRKTYTKPVMSTYTSVQDLKDKLTKSATTKAEAAEILKAKFVEENEDKIKRNQGIYKNIDLTKFKADLDIIEGKGPAAGIPAITAKMQGILDNPASSDDDKARAAAILKKLGYYYLREGSFENAFVQFVKTSGYDNDSLCAATQIRLMIFNLKASDDAKKVAIPREEWLKSRQIALVGKDEGGVISTLVHEIQEKYDRAQKWFISLFVEDHPYWTAIVAGTICYLVGKTRWP